MRTAFLYLLLLSLTACASGEATDPKLEEAAALHDKALQAEEALRPLLDSLEQRHNQISIQGRALTEAERSFVQSVSALQQRFERWKEERIEVPGHEHTHDHDHDHGHGHTHGKKMPEATPEHMLNIQRESLDSILVLKGEAEVLVKENL
ncbi:MAG: hypothetical protein RIC19_08530 [Phaeodactylibacter sp.]|uniref:hypothetical protein n=1 Tax=Phaeodactylibacter sp. TaxID=1940289 RepID=UPI0032EB0DFA